MLEGFYRPIELLVLNLGWNPEAGSTLYKIKCASAITHKNVLRDTFWCHGVTQQILCAIFLECTQFS